MSKLPFPFDCGTCYISKAALRLRNLKSELAEGVWAPTNDPASTHDHTRVCITRIDVDGRDACRGEGPPKGGGGVRLYKHNLLVGAGWRSIVGKNYTKKTFDDW